MDLKIRERKRKGILSSRAASPTAAAAGPFFSRAVFSSWAEPEPSKPARLARAADPPL
jgi:hypothetical protein